MIYTKDQEYLKKFGKQLKKIREEKGMSQEQLANLAEVSLPQITRIEHGTINSTICTIKSLANGLGVETALLFGFESKTWMFEKPS